MLFVPKWRTKCPMRGELIEYQINIITMRELSIQINVVSLPMNLLLLRYRKIPKPADALTATKISLSIFLL